MFMNLPGREKRPPEKPLQRFFQPFSVFPVAFNLLDQCAGFRQLEITIEGYEAGVVYGFEHGLVLLFVFLNTEASAPGSPSIISGASSRSMDNIKG